VIVTLQPPDRGRLKSYDDDNQRTKEMENRDGVWTTWLSVDGEPLEGSEIEHPNMHSALRWLRTDHTIN
jgi:hypothetical protein